MRDVVRFYSVTGEYGVFSNFAPYPIVLDGRRWPTSEHYFQAQKFEDRVSQEAIRKVASPMVAAQRGRDRRRKLRRDWERVKLGVMRRAVEAKFTQHVELRAVLLATGDALLVEHTADDDYWGDGGDGSGSKSPRPHLDGGPPGRCGAPVTSLRGDRGERAGGAARRRATRST